MTRQSFRVDREYLRDLLARKKKNLIVCWVSFAEAKKSGQVLIAAGCLTQRYGMEVARKVPGVDGNPRHAPLDGYCAVVAKFAKVHIPEPVYHLPEAANSWHGIESGCFTSQCGWAKCILNKWRMAARRPCCVLRYSIDQRHGGFHVLLR